VWDAAAALSWCALLATFIFYIWLIPDNWYGGSGTVGNRYFLMLVPLAFTFAPRGREAAVAAAAVVSVVLFLRPIFLAPVYHSLRPGAHATRATFRLFPAELTMLNDLSVFTEPWRKKQPIGDFGDRDAQVPASPTAYYLYFLDNGTFGQEPLLTPEREIHGFWLRGGQSAEVILRMLDIAPIRSIRFRVTGGPAGDEVGLAAFAQEQTVRVAAGETREAVFAADSLAQFAYKDTYLRVLRFQSERSGADRYKREVGAFVEIVVGLDPP
jgi:hypothetical protein